MLALTGDASLTYSIDGHAPVTRAASLRLSGDIVLYAARLSGSADGRRVDYTPRHPPSHLGSDVTLTDVVIDQPYASANALTGTGLVVTEGRG